MTTQALCNKEIVLQKQKKKYKKFENKTVKHKSLPASWTNNQRQ